MARRFLLRIPRHACMPLAVLQCSVFEPRTRHNGTVVEAGKRQSAPVPVRGQWDWDLEAQDTVCATHCNLLMPQ
jgi:hypothetical protein